MPMPITQIPPERFQQFLDDAKAYEFMVVLIHLYGRKIAEEVAFEVYEMTNGRFKYPPITWPTF